VDRQPPRSTSNAIDLYIRTYYSLLRSSGDVRVRAFEEAHAFSESSLHAGARDPRPDIGAFTYAAARLPACMTRVRRVVIGQSVEQFAVAGFLVGGWDAVECAGRRRPNRWDGGDTLAVFVTSASDIDDLVPIVTAYQIEWNKLHELLGLTELGRQLRAGAIERGDDLPALVAAALELDEHDASLLCRALRPDPIGALSAMAMNPCDLSVRLLAGTLLEYRRATQRWWQEIEPAYRGEAEILRPVYFVSSNTHALCNLVGGFARVHRDRLFAYAREHDPEGLSVRIDTAIAAGDEAELADLGYYLLRQYINADPTTERRRTAEVQAADAASGIQTLTSPGHLDVNAQLFELNRIVPQRLDPRVGIEGLEVLAESNAVIINIDYPLGMGAYHHLTQLAQGVGEIRGIYVMGKAATLNARVGDVMLSTVAYDEHSQNTYLFRNCFVAGDIAPLVDGTVLDNQKALTVRSAFLQNRDYMNVFYREGYTVLEMEAGPYLSAIYEMVYPKRHPTDEVVHLSNLLPFDLGLIHYASDTPYSRRQSLLSKSLSYFGMDATYGCAIAILRRILTAEIARMRGA
jgi:hypothetical protein